jgi:hypothetical protein
MKKFLFNLFVRKVTVTIKKIPDEKRIEFLFFELIKHLQKSGVMLVRSDGFGAASIWIHNANTDKAEARIESTDGWSLKYKPNFKMEVKNNG